VLVSSRSSTIGFAGQLVLQVVACPPKARDSYSQQLCKVFPLWLLLKTRLSDLPDIPGWLNESIAALLLDPSLEGSR